MEDLDNILKYERAKINTYKVLELLGENYLFENYNTTELYIELLACGTYLQFVLEVGDPQITHLVGANFCRNRICPMCQYRRSAKLFAQMQRVTEVMEEEGWRFLHLVLTVPNCNGGVDLVNTIKYLYASFSKFKNYKVTKRAYHGYMRALEISYNYDNDTFHPHLHCIVAVRNSYFNDSRIYLSYDNIVALWQKACKADKPYQISIGAIKAGDYKGVAEVCKYCIKPLDLERGEDWQNLRILTTLGYQLKGQRFLQKYGVIKDYFNQVIGNDLDTDIKDESKQMFEYTYNWDDINMRYQRNDLGADNGN